jgi:hypothetical protein
LILGIFLLLLWLRLSEQGAVELTAPPFNKQAAGSFLALAELELCLLPPAGRGGEERKRLALSDREGAGVLRRVCASPGKGLIRVPLLSLLFRPAVGARG